jgi:5S rRNA maturation endonuclease (ribonuclease M5)
MAVNRAFRGYDWCGIVRDRGVIAVVEALGPGKLRLIHNERPQDGLTPCPACRQETRHRKTNDKRGPIGIRRDGMGWHCFQCEEGGDAVTLASWLCGEKGQVNSRVHEACEKAGLIGLRPIQRAPQPVAQQQPNYPPETEVQHLLYEAAFSIDKVPDPDGIPGVRWWLIRRGLDPEAVADFGCVVALPPSAHVPVWACSFNKPWPEMHYRLLAPLYDATGKIRSVHARNVATTNVERKTTNPSGYSMAGLVLACPRAVGLLRCEPDAIAHAQRYGVILTEGLTDWLTWKSAEPDKAVFGVLSGSWTQEHADKIPNGCRVVIATDSDDTGESYAQKIHATLDARWRSRRLTVARWRPSNATQGCK